MNRERNLHLWESVCAFIDAGIPITMTRLYWDGAKKRMDPRFVPSTGWQLKPPPTHDQVADMIRAGHNAFLYRLPRDVWVIDADNGAAMTYLHYQLGRPLTMTPRGAHWLVRSPTRPNMPADAPAGIDTEPRQLYGPGSYYA